VFPVCAVGAPYGADDCGGGYPCGEVAGEYAEYVGDGVNCWEPGSCGTLYRVGGLFNNTAAP